MLKVTADVFSGRPNPTWIVTDAKTAQKVLANVKENRKAITQTERAFNGLGLRSVNVEMLGESDEDKAVPRRFSLALNGDGGKLASTLIKAMTEARRVVLPDHALTPIDRKIQALLLAELKLSARRKYHKPLVRYPKGLRRTIQDGRAVCYYEISRFNPGYWNDDDNVQYNNNCYNYARNWRTNTFAQPGRAHGAMTTTMACPNVANAAMADGLVRTSTCLPDTEYPRRHVALVIWPGYDYHWYREQMGGFWGHKPGGTEARNTDNAGNLIVNPETCDRGGYTHFCGHFYAGKSVVIA